MRNLYLYLALVLAGCSDGPSSSDHIEQPLTSMTGEPLSADDAVRHASSSDVAPLPEPIGVVTNPGDLMTAVRGDPSLVVYTESLTPDQVEDLSSRITLVNWPDRERIPTTISHRPAQPEFGITDHELTIQPEAPLAEQWYAVLFDVRGLTEFRAAAPMVDGIATSRFRVGSQPVVRGVTFSPGDSEVGVTLELSERVVDTRPAESLITVRQGSTTFSCEAGDGDALGSENGAMEITIICPLFPMDAEVSVTIARDLQTRIGTRVQVPFDEAIDTLSLNPMRDGALRARDEIFQDATR